MSRLARATAAIAALLTSLCCPAATTYTYDALGRLTTVAYGSGTTITYAYDAVGNRTSVIVPGPPTIIVVSGSLQITNLSSAFGQPLIVKVLDGIGNGTAGATVAFTPPGGGASANCTAPAVTDGNGMTQTTCTANGVAGTYQVNAAVSGIAAPAVFTLINYPGASGTSTVLGVSANPAIFATAVTLTATITGNAPTGTVDFRVGSISIPGCSARPVMGGLATCVISSLALGNNNISALYSGDGQNAPGTSSLLALQIIEAPALPDTGQDTCYDGAGADVVPASDPASITRDAGAFPRQDCRYGRDAAAAAGALTKIGAGAGGRDYTKIANNGSTLAAGAPLGANPGDWACTKDNTTGLTWEVKTNTPADLRYQFHAYAWHSTDGATNGGDAGSAGTDTCSATLPSGQCNTQAFVTAVNTQQLCGFSDWRLPSHRELLTLVYLDGSAPTIAPDYFPNTLPDPFWSATTYARFPDSAWQVDFLSNYINNAKTQAVRVRLVRGGPF